MSEDCYVCATCGLNHPTSQHDEIMKNQGGLFLTIFPKCGTNIIGQMWTVGEEAPAWIPHGDNYLYPRTKYTRKERYVGRPKVENAIRTFPKVAYSHLAFRPFIWRELKARNAAVYVLIREPRDVAVSQMFHVQKWPDAGLNFRFPDGSHLVDRKDPLMDIIKTLPLRWDQFIPWVNNPDVMTVRFEDLIENRWETVAKMFIHGGTRVEAAGLGTIKDWINRIDPNTSMTYRRGEVGAWQEYFQDRHIKRFNKIMAERMEVLGYKL